jgi:hypothetical protein
MRVRRNARARRLLRDLLFWAVTAFAVLLLYQLAVTLCEELPRLINGLK